ncbi:MAG: DUF2917 domain-containing protein [Thiomonas sp.]|uniref:Uncharacterized protein n=1 Tax=mine drainage metagenome TaxID=410659 RepID=E6PN82_9ZZZZ
MREWNTDTLQVQRAWVALQTGDSLLLRGALGLRVEAAAPPCPGQNAPLLWLTEEGEPDDVFLRPGESHVLRGRGRMVASAWGPINLRVVAATSPAASAMVANARPSPVAVDAASMWQAPQTGQAGMATRPFAGTMAAQAPSREAGLPAACCGA